MKACIRYLSVVIIVLLLSAGRWCGVRDAWGEVNPPTDLKYTTGMYLTAEGIGLSEADAKNNALAEMSRIFEARIKSESLDRVKSIVKGAGGEESEQSIEQSINVLTEVELRGVQIVKTWKAEGFYHALAALDRLNARDNWLDEIKDLDARAETKLDIAGSAESRLMKLRALNEAVAFWLKREIVQSRLRVIGFDAEPGPYDIKSVFRMIAEIKAAMPVSLEISGEHGQTAKRALAEALGKAGLQISEDKELAEVVVSGDVELIALDVVEPGVVFTRATVSLSVLDKSTGFVSLKVSETAKAGHPYPSESARKAVLSASIKAAEKVLKLFEEPEGGAGGAGGAPGK